eukprot:scaffold139228_cov59-Cyclotella_meneghiniana.AAC.9
MTKKEIEERLDVCEKKCEYFCKHGQSYRRKHLQNRLSIPRKKRNAVAEQKILAIIRREKERAFWRRLNYVMGQRSGRSVRRVQVTQADGSIVEATTQKSIHEAIWSNIHGKRFHLAEQAPICKGKLRGDLGYMANTAAAAAVLNGTYECPDGTDEGTRDLFDEIAVLRSIVQENSVSTTISGDRWKRRWCKAKEQTSSSESGIHFGRYISGVQSNIIAQHDALKTTLCNKWGISLNRWSRGMSCMLEKIPGCCLIEKLRSIILMEADYNANNKELFGESI